jgi:hypothetical protein
MDLAAYGLMFASAFLAATVFPAQSELVLIGFLTAGEHSVVGMLIVASIGNVLGSVVNYYLGIGIQSVSRSTHGFPQMKLNCAGARLLSSLGAVVAVARLDPHHRRSADCGRRRHARAALELSGAGDDFEGQPVPGPCGDHAAAGVSRCPD